MRRFRSRAIVAALLFAASSSLRAQSADTTTRDLPTVARQIIAAAQYATFITADGTGQPQARTVQPLAPTEDWEVWFATNPRTRKVGQIRANPKVVLHYFDRTTLSYVALIGRAPVITDRATKDAHWDNAWSQFYPDRDSSVALIRVRAASLEVVSTNLKIVGDARTWRPPSVKIRQPTR